MELHIFSILPSHHYVFLTDVLNQLNIQYNTFLILHFLEYKHKTYQIVLFPHSGTPLCGGSHSQPKADQPLAEGTSPKPLQSITNQPFILNLK